jgi:group I intron endonuclease
VFIGERIFLTVKAPLYLYRGASGYVGSSSNLSRRFRHYFSLKSLKGYKGSSHIYRSLLKYGYSKFKLEILKYCSPAQGIKWEQYYFDLFKPEYNILKNAGSSFGFKHSAETLANMRKRKLSEEHRAKISEALKGENHPKGAGKPSQQIEVFDIKNNTTISYDSMNAAAKALNLLQAVISIYLKNNQEKAYKGRYIFRRV